MNDDDTNVTNYERHWNQTETRRKPPYWKFAPVDLTATKVAAGNNAIASGSHPQCRWNKWKCKELCKSTPLSHLKVWRMPNLVCIYRCEGIVFLMYEYDVIGDKKCIECLLWVIQDAFYVNYHIIWYLPFSQSWYLISIYFDSRYVVESFIGLGGQQVVFWKKICLSNQYCWRLL